MYISRLDIYFFKHVVLYSWIHVSTINTINKLLAKGKYLLFQSGSGEEESLNRLLYNQIML